MRARALALPLSVVRKEEPISQLDYKECNDLIWRTTGTRLQEINEIGVPTLQCSGFNFSMIRPALDRRPTLFPWKSIICPK